MDGNVLFLRHTADTTEFWPSRTASQPDIWGNLRNRERGPPGPYTVAKKGGQAEARMVAKATWLVGRSFFHRAGLGGAYDDGRLTW